MTDTTPHYLDKILGNRHLIPVGSELLPPSDEVLGEMRRRVFDRYCSRYPDSIPTSIADLVDLVCTRVGATKSGLATSIGIHPRAFYQIKGHQSIRVVALNHMYRLMWGRGYYQIAKYARAKELEARTEMGKWGADRWK